MPGSFIVLEGPDGSGTTLHTQLLAERLTREGRDVLRTAEPTDGPIGQGIREILKEGGIGGMALQLLFSADRAEHVEEVIEPARRGGRIVVCDRYIPSTLAYGEALGLDTVWLKDVNKKFIQPDRTFFLLPPLSVCLERLERRPSCDMLEHADLRERVYDAYQRVAEGNSSIVVVDTSGEKAEVAEQIYARAC